MAGPSAGGHRRSGPRTAASRRSSVYPDNETGTATRTATTSAAAYGPQATAVTGVNSVVTNEHRAGSDRDFAGRGGQRSRIAAHGSDSGYPEANRQQQQQAAPADQSEVYPQSIGPSASPASTQTLPERTDASDCARDVICVSSTAGHGDPSEPSGAALPCDVTNRHGDSSELHDDADESEEIMDVCDYGSEQIVYANIDRTNERDAASTGNSHESYYLGRPLSADGDQSSSAGNLDRWTIDRRGVAFEQSQRPTGVATIQRHFQTDGVAAPAGVAATAGTSISAPSAGAPSTTKVAWRRREQQESASTEGSLRAMLNKLAPTQNSFNSLATQVAGHLLEDEAPEELARQLVDRAQLEPMYAATYARLCSVLVRVRSGYVFYKHLMARCQTTFAQGVRALIVEPMETCDDTDSNPPVSGNNSPSCNGARTTSQLPQQAALYPTPQHLSQPIQQQLRPQYRQQLVQQAVPTNSNGPSSYTANQAVSSGSTSSHGYNLASDSSTSAGGSNSNYPTGADIQRHRLKALVVFLCHLFIENQLSFDRLYDEYLKLLEVHLPGDDVAIECICSALSCAGQAIERARPQWVLTIVRQLQGALRPLHEQRKLRMIFMVQDIVDMQQRNWQQREPSALASASRMPRDQAEP